MLNNGVVEADTLEEMLALKEATSHSSVRKTPIINQSTKTENLEAPAQPSVPSTATDEEIWESYSKELKSKKYAMQRKVLALLRGAGAKGLTVQELSRLLKIHGSAAGGTVSGIGKKAISFMPVTQLIVRDEDGRYRAGPMLERFAPPEH
jgi:hypothetical protein